MSDANTGARQTGKTYTVSESANCVFALSSEDIRMPAGRIQYLYLYPMSFDEFLNALGE